ncbi:hypothetical protein MRX96_007561 [Rhipicephalus microplus]
MKDCHKGQLQRNRAITSSFLFGTTAPRFSQNRSGCSDTVRGSQVSMSTVRGWFHQQGQQCRGPHLLSAGGAPEPFLGFLLSDRHPIESPQPCMAEETSVLCPIRRIPELSHRAHQDVSLHHSRLLSVAIRDAIPRPARPLPAVKQSKPPSLFFAQPDRTSR